MNQSAAQTIVAFPVMQAPAGRIVRDHVRHSYEIEVTGESGHQFFTGFTYNISEGGLFVSTYATMPLRSRFDLSFRVPGLDHLFQVHCEVRWVREYTDGNDAMPPGMGVCFLDLTERERALLDQLLPKIETIFYDDDATF